MIGQSILKIRKFEVGLQVLLMPETAERGTGGELVLMPHIMLTGLDLN